MKTNKDYVSKFNDANYLFDRQRSELAAETLGPVSGKVGHAYSKSKDFGMGLKNSTSSFGQKFIPRISDQRRHSWLNTKTCREWQSSLPKSNLERVNVDSKDMFRVTPNVALDYDGVSKIIKEPQQFRKYLEEYSDINIYKSRAVKNPDFELSSKQLDMESPSLSGDLRDLRELQTPLYQQMSTGLNENMRSPLDSM